MNRLPVALAMFVLAAGCAKNIRPIDIQTTSAPVRAIEMDFFEPWIGTWEAVGESKMANGETIKFAGKTEYKWGLDRSMLIQHENYSIGDMKIEGAGFTVYDHLAKQFSGSWYSPLEGQRKSTAKYNEKSQSWHFTSTRHDQQSGQLLWNEGDLKMPDANTMQWKWTIWDAQHSQKLGEGTSTSYRAGVPRPTSMPAPPAPPTRPVRPPSL